MVPEDLEFRFIREITGDFSVERKLGQGAFGVVYKGVTNDGYEVAVKMLRTHLADIENKQFRNELQTLRKLAHQNIVQLLGYCYEAEKNKTPLIMPDGSKAFCYEMHTALCLEYLHNGSLQNLLSADESCEVKLDWHMRFKIIKGICEGLKYMHKERIYHFDLKPDNILLDKDMVPKIADFGLSRIFGQDMIRITHGPYGTLGYQPPEYIHGGELSEKFDIFSLGAIMIKIVSGAMGYPDCSDMSSHEFIDQVLEKWRNKLQETCISSDSLLEAYCRQVVTCTQIALNCLNEDNQKRPDIVKITESLNEIDTGVGKLPEKGCGLSVSEMTVQNKSIEMRMESKDITDVVEEHIVGRKEEKAKIITSLLESSSEKIILPIYGIGGIGKTTFSRLIKNDPKFKCYSKAWVHVSNRFDLNKIRQSIISELHKKESQAYDGQEIHNSLTKLHSGKKIMIVLDDLWEDDKFLLQDLTEMLHHDSKIIILVTTRSESVAERIHTSLEPYKILPLTNGMCWDIIKQRSGFGARDDKEKLRGIGQEIAQKCAGVALAAQSLGFTLRGKSFDQWMEVKDNDIWREQVSKDISLPNHVLASLMLSYNYMDPCLKLCFTYCAIFPKGHKIVQNDLIYQWISLGFIEPSTLRSTMELCRKYIVQLQGLSFFQVSPKTSEAYNEKATIFTIHDLVHDLATSLLGNRILDQSGQGNTRGSSCQYALLSDCSKALELCLTSRERLIALRFLDCCSTELGGAAFAPARSLRVLDLSECSIRKLPDSIGQLKQLRYLHATGVQDEMLPACITVLSHLMYLNLHGSSITALPESIGEMKGLMHLDLSGCTRIHELPVSFWNLEKLVHLDLSGCFHCSVSAESFGSLSRLEHLSLSKCKIKGDLAKALGRLTELQYLNLSKGFCFGSLCRGLKEVVVNLTKLRYLDVENFLESTMQQSKTERDIFLKLISSLPSLEYLNLAWTSDMHTIPESIGKLSKLHTLDLSSCTNLQWLPASISGIQSLKYLHVEGCFTLDKSTLPQYRKAAALLPNFVVHAADGGSSSNFSDLEYENPRILEISRLENVKSAEEARRIKLVEKQSIEDLKLVWTREARRFVDDDAEVLKQLMPPDTLEKFRLQGYESVSFPSWMMMNIATSLPQLAEVTLLDLPTCNNLPPLGQLPNLVKLDIRRMDRIRRIDGGLYGGVRAFPRLKRFELHDMKCLEEWNTAYTSDDDDFNEDVFPNLSSVSIVSCPKLRLKTSLPLVEYFSINGSDGVMLSSLGASFSVATTRFISVTTCEAPLHQWSLLRHVPCLKVLNITGCSDLTCSSTDDLL
ncbi:hypothetical protein PVAP13_8NG104301 [Panicum virgatum]|uniref:non-specific serine/threonine protein kinase n=1 Tax=Panicum virgatum TaxID=38727 RepID=A0A8T0P857_PANVG|nr:hypothetical protein PVAP13_8NG104301 [Panicum virgatum]